MPLWAIWSVIAFAGYVGLCILLRLNHRRLLFRPWKFLIDPRLCAVEDVELVDIHPSADERLYVWHRKPEVEGAPVLIYFDGNRGNISIWNRRWRRIASSGAGFIAVSYRGYGGSTRNPSEAGLHEDAQMAWEWANTVYPEHQLALHGFSLGTGVAAHLASTVGAVPTILEAPYYSIVKNAQDLFPFLPARLILKDSFETFRWVPDIKGPLLIAHGAKDRIVPIRHGERLFKLAREPKKFMRFAEANHLTLPANGLYPAIWAFLGYELPASHAEQAFQGEQDLPIERPSAAPETAVKRLDADQRRQHRRRDFVPPKK